MLSTHDNYEIVCFSILRTTDSLAIAKDVAAMLCFALVNPRLPLKSGKLNLKVPSLIEIDDGDNAIQGKRKLCAFGVLGGEGGGRGSPSEP